MGMSLWAQYMNMIQFGMRRNSYLVVLIVFIFSCGSRESAGRNDKSENEQLLRLTFHFENGKDTVILGEQTDLAIKIENNVFDSLSLFIGTVENKKLVDTMGIIPVKNKIAFFKFVPRKTGTNTIEGVVKEFKSEGEKTIIKSTPFTTTYFCVRGSSVEL